MKTDEIKLLYEYNYWAFKRILDACGRVSEAQFTAPTNYGYRSLQAALVHALDSEWVWRRAFQEKISLPTDEAAVWDYDEITEVEVPTLSALNERWQVQEREMRAYLNSLHDDDLYRLVRYKIPGGIVRERVLWHCLLHVVNHATQHRSEAAMLLTSYGQSPGELDITQFLNQYFNLQVE